MHFAFILPADAGADHAYAAGLTAGLHALGHAAALIETADLGATLARLPQGTAAVLDAIGLTDAALPPLEPILAARDVTVLVHHAGAGDRTALQAALPRFHRVMTSSLPVQARLTTEFGLAADRVAMVEPGLDDLPRSRGSGGETCAILSVGVLTARKGHDVLLRALARLPDLDWTLTVAGDPRRDRDYPAVLRSLADDLGVAGRVTLAPGAVDAALDGLWRQADLFALATRWEAYPAAVAQALRRGLPVATTTAAATLMAPELGAVCPIDDVDQMSKALRRLIFDTALRTEVADAAWTAGQALPGWTEQARRFAGAMEG